MEFWLQTILTARKIRLRQARLHQFIIAQSPPSTFAHPLTVNKRLNCRRGNDLDIHVTWHDVRAWRRHVTAHVLRRLVCLTPSSWVTSPKVEFEDSSLPKWQSNIKCLRRINQHAPVSRQLSNTTIFFPLIYSKNRRMDMTLGAGVGNWERLYLCARRKLQKIASNVAHGKWNHRTVTLTRSRANVTRFQTPVWALLVTLFLRNPCCAVRAFYSYLEINKSAPSGY